MRSTFKLGDQVEHREYQEGVVVDHAVYANPDKAPDCVVFFGDDDLITLPASELRKVKHDW